MQIKSCHQYGIQSYPVKLIENIEKNQNVENIDRDFPTFLKLGPGAC